VTDRPAPADVWTRLAGLALVLATAVGWGLNWPATKFLISICPPLSARGVSGLAAAGFLFGIAAACGERLAVPRFLWARLLIISLLNVSAWMGLTTASLLWLSAGQAATLAYTMPAWATILAWPLLGERPSPRQILAVSLGLVGVTIQFGDIDLRPGANQLPGVVLALSAATLFATGTVLSKRMPIPLSRFALTAWQVLLGSVPLLAVGQMLERPHFSALPMIAWLSLGYTALISMGLCYVLWNAAIRRLKASQAAVGILLTPIIGFAASLIALGDQMSPSQVISLAMVVGGIICATKE
jgi:drug/metabolite transporter (DMT)-like permease